MKILVTILACIITGVVGAVGFIYSGIYDVSALEPDAVSLAEKLRVAVYETSVKGNRNQFNITASFGVAEVGVGEREIDQCLGRADSALYAAKKAGRNCVKSFAALPREARKFHA